MMRKLAFGLVLGAALVIPVAACGSGDDGDTSTESSSSASPLETVTEAATTTAETSFSLSVAAEDASENLLGSYDASTKSATFSQAVDGETMTITVTADSLYFVDLAELDGQSMRLDLSRLPTEGFTDLYLDPTFPLSLVGAATDATSIGDGSYNGTLDLSAVQTSTILGGIGLEAATAAAGDSAGSIAYTVTIDENGYITEAIFELPGLSDDGASFRYETTFSDFGAAAAISLPEESQVMDAPDEIYESW